jgi:hypothetical protein
MIELDLRGDGVAGAPAEMQGGPGGSTVLPCRMSAAATGQSSASRPDGRPTARDGQGRPVVHAIPILIGWEPEQVTTGSLPGSTPSPRTASRRP